MPSRLHMIVLPTFRNPPPAGLVLHKATLPPGDIQRRSAYRVATPLRTLLDLAGSFTSSGWPTRPSPSLPGAPSSCSWRAREVRDALRAHLRNRSDGMDVCRLQRQVRYARFLARLFGVTGDTWVLKGGDALKRLLAGHNLPASGTGSGVFRPGRPSDSAGAAVLLLKRHVR